MKITNPVLRYHGGKFRLAQWLMGFFPKHLCYVEPFGGAAGVLLQKERAYAEVYNDLDGDVVNFFEVVRDPELRAALIEQLTMTPYARREFELSWQPERDPVERARRLAIRAQMGFGSTGATKGTTGFRIDTKREYGTAQSLWAQYPEAIEAAGLRLAGVLIECRPAISTMRAHDHPETLHFVDPPYMHATRRTNATGNTAGNGRSYRHEMSDDDHQALLDTVLDLEGFVVLSGYSTDLYHDILSGWTVHSTESRISAGRGTALRTESIWINPACEQALKREASQLEIFA